MDSNTKPVKGEDRKTSTIRLHMLVAPPSPSQKLSKSLWTGSQVFVFVAVDLAPASTFQSWTEPHLPSCSSKMSFLSATMMLMHVNITEELWEFIKLK